MLTHSHAPGEAVRRASATGYAIVSREHGAIRDVPGIFYGAVSLLAVSVPPARESRLCWSKERGEEGSGRDNLLTGSARTIPEASRTDVAESRDSRFTLADRPIVACSGETVPKRPRNTASWNRANRMIDPRVPQFAPECNHVSHSSAGAARWWQLPNRRQQFTVGTCGAVRTREGYQQIEFLG